MELQLELRHDAEVPPASAQPPKQIRVLRLARMNEPAVRRDDVGGDEVVASEAVVAHQPADAAAEGEATDAGGRNEAARRRQPVRLRLVVDIRPDGAATDRRAASLWIDPN